MLFRKKINTYLSLSLLGMSLGMGACVKQKIDSPSLAEFAAPIQSNQGSYFVTSDPNSVFKIPVGITAAAGIDRVIHFSISSSSGAASGQQYSLPDSTSVTIKAGKVIDSIPVKGIFEGYDNGRKDTLVFTLTGGDVNILAAASTYTLTVQQFCAVVLADMEGDYNNCYDDDGSGPSGPYTITFPHFTSTSATTADAAMVGFWGGADMVVKMDWSNPANLTLNLPRQFMFNYPGLGDVYAAGNGHFSSCDNTFTLNYVVTTASLTLGSFTTTIVR